MVHFTFRHAIIQLFRWNGNLHKLIIFRKGKPNEKLVKGYVTKIKIELFFSLVVRSGNWLQNNK